MYACLAVTWHLHFWQNDRDFLRATAVTRGWNGYRNKSQHRKSTLEKKILPPFQQGFEPATFQSRVRCSNHWAIPAPKCVGNYRPIYRLAYRCRVRSNMKTLSSILWDPILSQFRFVSIQGTLGAWPEIKATLEGIKTECHCSKGEPVWPSGKALGWWAEDPRFESASAVLSLQKLWSVDTVLFETLPPHN